MINRKREWNFKKAFCLQVFIQAHNLLKCFIGNKVLALISKSILLINDSS